MGGTFLYPERPVQWAPWAKLTPDEWPDDAFTPTECKGLIDLALQRDPEPGTIIDFDMEGTVDRQYRNVDKFVLWRDEESACYAEKIVQMAQRVNRGWWNFDLTVLYAIEVLRYGVGQHYVEHVDLGNTQETRKLSVIIQLSDPGEYDGGDVELLFKSEPDLIPKEQGSIVVFPSWTMHRVTPVTRGERWAAVAWIDGPPFR